MACDWYLVRTVLDVNAGGGTGVADHRSSMAIASSIAINSLNALDGGAGLLVPIVLGILAIR